MTNEDRVRLLTSYERSFCPLFERDAKHGLHPKCKCCRFREVKCLS